MPDGHSEVLKMCIFTLKILKKNIKISSRSFSQSQITSSKNFQPFPVVTSHRKIFYPLRPEIQKNWIFAFGRNMLFEMLSWNWFEFHFREIHCLKSFFWPYDISYAGHLRVCLLLMWLICWIVISMISTDASSSFNTFYWKMKALPCKDRKATILALTLSIHNLSTDRARELFKLSKEAKHIGSIFKKSGTFMFNNVVCFVADHHHEFRLQLARCSTVTFVAFDYMFLQRNLSHNFHDARSKGNLKSRNKSVRIFDWSD